MGPYEKLILITSSILIFTNHYGECSQNITCYQCTRTKNIECNANELLPCPSNMDRCVTHIMKDETDGFKIKRECGLGPCTFTDLMMTKGLGLDACDRSRHEYFCIFCCKENGCNKDGGSALKPSTILIYLVSCFVILLNVVGKSYVDVKNRLD